MLLVFIQIAMNPVKYANSRARFDYMRERLNKVLLFSGLMLGEDGKLRRAEPVATIPEAERRANQLRERLEERNTHPDVLVFCRAELLQDNYFNAVLEATKSVADRFEKGLALKAMVQA